MTTKRWEYLGRAAKGEHKFFREKATGRIAVADNSGAYPEQTDDGVLYLDEKRKIGISRGGHILPLLDKDGREVYTFLSPAELPWIVRRWPDLWPNALEVQP